MLWLLAGVLMIAPATAAAQDRKPTPSAEELWREYPLEPSPQPTTPTPAESRPASAAATPADRAQEDMPLPVLLGAAGALLAALALLVRRGGGRRSPKLGRSLAAAVLPAAAATAMVPAGEPRSRRLTSLGVDPSRGQEGSEQGPPRDAARPPDPRRAWTAEVEWRDEGEGPRFCVVARGAGDDAGVPVATSRPLQWPPPNARAVRRLSIEAERLETRLLDAGWTPLPPGSAWYAKRFAWAPAPVSALPQTADPPGAGRFTRTVDWPPEDRWRCEIRWHAGYVNSSFEAVAREPGRRRGVTVCRSEYFRWLMMADPELGAPEYTAQLRRVTERLVAAGWEPAGEGKHWYELRFVWPHEGAPPKQLEPAPAAAAATPPGGNGATG